jgi:hypothetical protein
MKLEEYDLGTIYKCKLSKKEMLVIEVEKPVGPSDSFGKTQLSFQIRYRWELAPLSDLFVVYTRGADESIALKDNNFSDLFDHAVDNPLVDLFVVKIRYRFGS